MNRGALVQHALERSRFDFLSSEHRWPNVVKTHGDDFVFLPNVHPIERLIIRVGNLQCDVEKPLVTVQKGDEHLDGIGGSCKKEVDAFWGQQHRSFEAGVDANTAKHRLQGISVVKLHKPITGDVGD